MLHIGQTQSVNGDCAAGHEAHDAEACMIAQCKMDSFPIGVRSDAACDSWSGPTGHAAVGSLEQVTSSPLRRCNDCSIGAHSGHQGYALLSSAAACAVESTCEAAPRSASETVSMPSPHLSFKQQRQTADGGPRRACYLVCPDEEAQHSVLFVLEAAAHLICGRGLVHLVLHSTTSHQCTDPSLRYRRHGSSSPIKHMQGSMEGMEAGMTEPLKGS